MSFKSPLEGVFQKEAPPLDFQCAVLNFSKEVEVGKNRAARMTDCCPCSERCGFLVCTAAAAKVLPATTQEREAITNSSLRILWCFLT